MNTNQNSPVSFEPPLPNSGKVEEITPAPKSHKFLIVGLLLLLILTAGAAAYVFAQNQSLKSQLGLSNTCEYEGQTYEVGEGFTASDGCNSCSCEPNGEVACTDMACFSDEEAVLDPTTDWETYSNSKCGYSLHYPLSWNLIPEPEDAIIGATTISSPEIKMQLSCGEIMPGENPDQAIYRLNSRDDGYGVPTVDSLGQLTIKDKLAYKQIITSVIGDPVLEYYIFYKDNYILNVGFTPEALASEAEEVDQILSTFEFVDSQSMIPETLSFAEYGYKTEIPEGLKITRSHQDIGVSYVELSTVEPSSILFKFGEELELNAIENTKTQTITIDGNPVKQEFFVGSTKGLQLGDESFRAIWTRLPREIENSVSLVIELSYQVQDEDVALKYLDKILSTFEFTN